MKRLLILLLVLCLGGALFAQDKVMTLDECVGIALEQNPALVMSEFQVKMAGKDVWMSLAELLPSASAGVSYYHSVVGPSSAVRIDPGTGIPVPLRPDEIKSWSGGSRINVNENVSVSGFFNFFQRRALHDQAQHTFKLTKQNTIYLVKERYYNLLKAEKMLEVAEETARSSEESLKRANALYEVGKAPKSDVLTAKVQAETDKLGVIKAQNSLSIARASLNHVLGFNVDNAIKVVDNLDVPEIEVGYQDALSNAMSSHPSVLSAQSALSASKAGVGVAFGRWMPSLSLTYQYSWNHEEFDRINEMFDKDYSWYTYASLSIPLFQGFSRVAQTSKALIAKKSSQEALIQAKRDIELEVKQAYFEVEQYKKQIAVARNAEEAAAEGLRLGQERYALGAGTMLDLLNAQVQSRQAKSDFIQALYSYKYAIARLERAMGQLNR